jgi:hypothetical protein
MRLVLALALASGCGTVHVEYATGHTQPKLVTVQLYASAVHNKQLGGDALRYDESLGIEAGCAKAALSVGQPMSIWRVGTVTETDATVTYRSDTIVPRIVAERTGADVVMTGRARLTPQSGRVEELTLEAHAPDGTLVARASFASDDGAEPADAGERTCQALFARWGAARGRAHPPRAARSVFLMPHGSTPQGDAFTEGCAKGIADAGAPLVQHKHPFLGPGTIWYQLAQSTDADAFIEVDLSWPLDEPIRISTALVWRLDASGAIEDLRFYSTQSTSQPAEIGRKLCRDVLGVRR